MSSGLDIALIQTRTPATARAALAHVEPLIREAASGGAKFVLTPEGSNVLEQRRARRDAEIRGVLERRRARFELLRHDVTFPLFEKIDVNGASADPLFERLKADAPGLMGSKAVKWNFTKFLVDREGRTVRRYAPTTKPEELRADIETLLG